MTEKLSPKSWQASTVQPAQDRTSQCRTPCFSGHSACQRLVTGRKFSYLGFWGHICPSSPKSELVRVENVLGSPSAQIAFIPAHGSHHHSYSCTADASPSDPLWPSSFSLGTPQPNCRGKTSNWGLDHCCLAAFWPFSQITPILSRNNLFRTAYPSTTAQTSY